MSQPSPAPPGPGVDCGGGGTEVGPGVDGQVGALGEALAEQAGGVLVAAALPVGMRVTGVDVRGKCAECRGYETVRPIQSRYAAEPSAMVNAVISGFSQG